MSGGSGALRHIVTIKSIGRTPDGYGGNVRSDPTLNTIRAEVTPASQREIFQYSQNRQVITHTIRTRYTTTITQGMTLVHDDVDHYVVSVTNPDQRKRFLKIMTRTGGPQ